MKVLSIKQPWASLIIEFGKNMENRSWVRSYLGPLVIAASAAPDTYREGITYTVEAALSKTKLREFNRRWDADDFPLGKILGIVDLVDYWGPNDRNPSPWADNTLGGVYQLELDNPRKLAKPIPAKGRLGFWDPPPSAMPVLCRLLNEGRKRK